MSTRRERIIELLLKTDEPLSLRDIALTLEEKEKAIARDIKHIAKTVKRQYRDMQLVMYPAVCRKCGYVFSKSENIDPGRCPRCKSEWIEKPKFKIIQK
ncbi:MAG: transcriptional regulator [Candidatus Asgardarchaeia archaeon]